METITTESPYTPEEEKIRENLLNKVEELGIEHYHIPDKERYQNYYENSSDFRKNYPTYSDLLEKVHAERLRNPLEGAILIHGFQGNLPDPDKREIGISSDKDVLRKIIRQGAVVSPSKRQLTRQELLRYGDAYFDINRVCFEARTGRKGDGKGGGSYISGAFFAMPVSGLEGTKISNDIAFSGPAMAAYNEEGVSIPLEKGILFINEYDLKALLPDIKERSEILNIDLPEYLNKHFRILPSHFRNRNIFWKTVTASIEPSKEVKYHPTIVPKLQEKISTMGMREAFISEKIAEKKDLGEAKLLENTLLGSPYVKPEHNKQYLYYLSKLTKFASILKQNPEALREVPDLIDIHTFEFRAYLYELTEKDSVFAYKLRKLFDIYRNFQDYNQQRLKRIWEKRPEAIHKHTWQGEDTYVIANRYKHRDDSEI